MSPASTTKFLLIRPHTLVSNCTLLLDVVRRHAQLLGVIEEIMCVEDHSPTVILLRGLVAGLASQNRLCSINHISSYGKCIEMGFSSFILFATREAL